MEGRSRAAQRRHDESISLAWHMVALDREKRLKPLSKYLSETKPKHVQTADDVANIFLSLKAKGKSVKIREAKR